MLSKQITEILQHEGPVVIVTNSASGPHVVATWNSFPEVINDTTLAIPAWGYQQTERNIKSGSSVQLLLATKELPGRKGSPGRGFKLTGKARFETEGEFFQIMRSRFEGIRAAFVITIEQVEQLM